MPKHPGKRWVRTVITDEAHAAATRVALLLDWNLPGVYAAILNNVLTTYEPELLADDIRDALRSGTLDEPEDKE